MTAENTSPKYAAIIPSKPEWMEQSDYEAVVQSSQCSRLGSTCGSVPCGLIAGTNSYRVEIDHIVPRSRGGDNGRGNLQLLCACENRKKWANVDDGYRDPTFFDSIVNTDRLRPSQLDYGYNLAVFSYKDLWLKPPRELFDRFMLIAWIVGAGKTVGMSAILLGINRAIQMAGPGRRRIKRVLWMVHQETLVDSLTEELKEELSGYGIVDHAPEVAKIKTAADWKRNILADIVVCCPQSIWERDNRSLSDESLSLALSRFEAIVIDEGHFAIDKYLQIAMFAPNALKFSMTATPMDSDGLFLSESYKGKYKDRFFLFSAYGYQQAYDDGVMKTLLSYEEGVERGYYKEELGGESIEFNSGSVVIGEENTKNPNCSQRSYKVIRSSCDAATIESRETGCDMHIMIRAGSINEAKNIQKSLSDEGYQWPKDSHGWGSTAVYSGAKGSKKLSDAEHPWMLVKKRDGKASSNSKRVVITVDIGQFGINNRYCSVIGYVEPQLSLIEIIQRIGRAIRGIPNKKSHVRIVWNGQKEEFKEKLKQAIDYILNMHEYVPNAFPKLRDIVTAEKSALKIDPSIAIITPIERAQIASISGNNESLSPAEIIDAWVSEHKKSDVGDRKLDAAADYARKLNGPDSDNMKNIEWSFDEIISDSVSVVVSESAKLEYSTIELINSIVNDRIIVDSVFKSETIRRVESGDECTIANLNKQLRELESRWHVTPSTSYKVWEILGSNGGGKKSDFDSSYYKRLVGYFNGIGLSFEVMKKVIAMAINKSTADYFGLPNIKEETYAEYQPQIAAALCRPRVEDVILKRAKAIIINRLRNNHHSVSGVYNTYRNQIDQIINSRFDDEM